VRLEGRAVEVEKRIRPLYEKLRAERVRL